jgi:hypothetical protein
LPDTASDGGVVVLRVQTNYVGQPRLAFNSGVAL